MNVSPKMAHYRGISGSIVPVSRMDEVLARAMTRKPEPIEWDETTTTAAAVPEEAPVQEEAWTLTAH